ncbi:MAG: hypothetical protein U9O96_02305 [Candidatus Thermoplasmatota archaeon]|nr:hypothetical protein [Candidatus Thermoplasmatota archaeon]
MLPNENAHMVNNSLMGRVLSEFYLLERHIKMLKLIVNEEPIGIIKLSENTGLPEHKVRYSPRVLEKRLNKANSSQSDSNR